jgi:hypothetical protein
VRDIEKGNKGLGFKGLNVWMREKRSEIKRAPSERGNVLKSQEEEKNKTNQ